MLTNRLKSLAVSLVALFAVNSASAQGLQPLPMDPDVRYGKLDNGLTYFIRHNKQPKERAHFFIAQKVGSMLENDDQSGLAHFLEHMAFNGTKNFPGKGLINYLETVGVKFGANLNAYTGFDETVYTIMDAPTTRNGIIDSCLLILHDWSNNISLEHKEIDNERGVIHEEWRGGQNASMRMISDLLAKVFPGHLYGKRLPIGTMDVVLNFPYKAIEDYYKKWYRPDLQGLIIVGDIDVDYVEKKIKEQFADVPAPQNPAERIYAPVPDNATPIVAISTDPEATDTSVGFSYRRDVVPAEIKASANGLVIDYINAALSQMFRERIAEIMQKPNAPFLFASMSNGKYLGLAVTKDAISFDAGAKEGGYKPALFAIVAEMKRAREHGFTPSEYDRARTDILKSFEEQLKDKANRTNDAYANEYKNYFVEGGYIPGIEVENQLITMIAPQITVEQINEIFKQYTEEKNLVISLMGPKKEGITYPTEEQLLAEYKEAMAQTVEPYKEEVSNEKLIEKLPKKGKIVSEKKNLAYGATLWTLNNGIKVYLKKTDYKDNQILVSGISPGGFLLFDTKKDLYNIQVLGSVANLGGVGNFSTTQLNKALTGRRVSVETGIESYFETVNARTSNADVETMFQLIYLNMTSPRSDVDAYEAFKQRTIEGLRGAKADPMTAIYMDTIPATLYPHAPLQHSLHEEDFEKVNYERAMQMYRERFADAGDFTFFIVGTFDEATLRPLVEQYLGALPNLKRKDKSPFDKMDLITNKAQVKDIKVEMDTKTATVFDFFVSTMPYDLESRLKMRILNEVLSQQYTKSIREDEGGTYGVGVGANVNRYKKGEARIIINFKTSPDKVAHLNAKAKSELSEMAKNGINREYFDKTVENMIKNYNENQHENTYWLSVLSDKFFHNEDAHAIYMETLKKITPESIRQYLADFLKGHRYFELVITSDGKDQ